MVYVEFKDVIIFEGILVFEDKRFCDLMDIKFYVDIDVDLCIIRWIMRDINECGCFIDFVIE